ncbi:MAG: DUF6308 family protein [Micrococcales bacterium]|nr:DUF6308 family protein [Micrococcales bacterium]
MKTTFDTYRLHLPAIFEVDNQPLAKALLARYFARRPDGSSAFTGAHFDTLGGGWDNPSRSDQITGTDLLAVTYLSVRVPPSAADQILGDQAERIKGLLRSMPKPEETIWEVPQKELGEGSGAWQLWDLLMQIEHIKWTTASKIMARKRANLIPIFDQVIGNLFGPGDLNHWELMRQLMLTEVQDQPPLHVRLAQMVSELESAAVRRKVTPLRAFDAIAWYAYNPIYRQKVLDIQEELPAGDRKKERFDPLLEVKQQGRRSH